MKHLRICILGNMLGRNPGYVTTQGQILSDLLAEEGYSVVSASSKLNRVFRLFDILVTAMRMRNVADILILEVYSGMNFWVTEIVGRVARFLRISTVFVLHGGNLPQFASRWPRWTKRALSRANRLIAPSGYLTRELDNMGLSIRVIPNVVDLSSCVFELRRSVSPKLFWMRAFHDIYNPHMAVDVFQTIKLKYPNATLVMAGADKGLEKEIKREINERSIQESVRFPGFLNEHEKIREFSNADIFLNTNRIDNMPVAVLEARANGLPVVATCVGGIPDLIENGRTGLLVPNGDVKGMVSAVESLLNNPELAEKISFNGRRLAERSSWENVRLQWEDLFRELQFEKKAPELVGLPVGKVTNP